MARTAVTPTTLGPNAFSAANIAGTTIDSTLVTNGVVITGVPLEELVLQVTNTASSALDCTISAGDNPPADAAGLGALVSEFSAGNVTPQIKYVGPFSSARFIQAGGTEAGALFVDFETGFTGTLRAFRVPRTA